MLNRDLKNFRDKNNLSQKELGVLFGMVQSEVSRMESGQRKMTRLQRVHLAAIEIISEAGLLAEYKEKRTKIAQKGKPDL